MTTRPVRGRLNPLWLQKQAERRRLAKTARVNRQKTEVPLLESGQAKAAKAKYEAWKEAAKQRKRDEAKAAREAARKAAEGADLFDTARAGEAPKIETAGPRQRRRSLDRYEELK
jgi:hypothetical protein